MSGISVSSPDLGAVFVVLQFLMGLKRDIISVEYIGREVTELKSGDLLDVLEYLLKEGVLRQVGTSGRRFTCAQCKLIEMFEAKRREIMPEENKEQVEQVAETTTDAQEASNEVKAEPQTTTAEQSATAPEKTKLQGGRFSFLKLKARVSALPKLHLLEGEEREEAIAGCTGKVKEIVDEANNLIDDLATRSDRISSATDKIHLDLVNPDEKSPNGGLSAYYFRNRGKTRCNLFLIQWPEAQSRAWYDDKVSMAEKKVGQILDAMISFVEKSSK